MFFSAVLPFVTCDSIWKGLDKFHDCCMEIGGVSGSRI